jgi:hypothetical protein
MKRALLGSLAAASLAVAGLTAMSSPASAATCQTWQDENTFGVSCSGANAYYAKVRCSNGKDARGVTTNDGRWSYAYCTSFGTNVRIAGGATGTRVWA